ncbi:MAG: antitermination protein NusB [Eggerthellaceae bacterium]|nr:antitermination protein NusB [Eggerthellaceae bacterium]
MPGKAPGKGPAPHRPHRPPRPQRARQGQGLRVSPARRAALEVGTQVRLRKAFTSEVIAARIEGAGLSPSDRAFATRLALGVTSAQGMLDEMIGRHLRAPGGLDPAVRDALRISCYEILFLEKAGYAAVDQGVELVRCVAPKAAGLANAVLRKIAHERPAFPFGDPESDIEALARLCAFPTWLAASLVEAWGHGDARAFMEASNEPAPLFIAVNSLKASEQEVEEAFGAVGTTLARVSLSGEPVPGCFLLEEGALLQRAGIKGLFDEGKILVSDAASQFIAAHILPDTPPAGMLEIGSGRGTKTILLQNAALRRYKSQLPLEALDAHRFKADILKERAATYGLRLDRTHVADARRQLEGTFERESFGFVFVDAPCSGLGTLRRHPEIRWRIQEADIPALADAGLGMLEQAAGLVRPGGHLAYSTCTVTREENQGVIARFLGSTAGKCFRLEPLVGRPSFATRVSPGSSDAHFAVRMARIG